MTLTHFARTNQQNHFSPLDSEPQTLLWFYLAESPWSFTYGPPLGWMSSACHAMESAISKG